MISQFATGLALVAISANANSWGQAPPQNPEWIGAGSYQPSWQPSHQPSHNYWQPAPEAAPEAAPEVAPYNPWAPQPSHDHYYPPAPPAKPEGWYSHTQQYSNPNIEYVPVATKAVYAICEFDANNFLELAQLPHHPVYVRGSLSDFSDGTMIDIIINTKGKLGANCDVADTGAVFNPLFETDKYGNPNPYQDPARGTIETQTADVNGDISIDGTVTVMQNLAGDESLIGRSLSLIEVGGDDVIACCVIGRDMAPMPEAVPEAVPEAEDPHHHPHYPSHGYPQYPSHGGYQPSYQPHPQQYPQYNNW